VGGFVGLTEASDGGNAEIRNSYSSGAVRGDDNVGGFAGFVKYTAIRSSGTSGSVRGGDNAGGFVGLARGSIIQSSEASGFARGNHNVGGFAGYSVSSTIQYSRASGSVKGGNNAGGFAGFTYVGVLEENWSSGAVSSNNIARGFSRITSNSLFSTRIHNNWSSSSVYSPGDNSIPYIPSSNEVNRNNWFSGMDIGSISTATTFPAISQIIFNKDTVGIRSESYAIGTAQLLFGGGWEFISYSIDDWNFDAGSYPNLKRNVASVKEQLVHQVAGHIYLANIDVDAVRLDVFLGANNIQNDITVDVDASIDGAFAIFDTNAAAPNDEDRQDFFPCEPNIDNPSSVGDLLLTTTGANRVTITLKIAKGTSNPSDWHAIQSTRDEDDACAIAKHTAGRPAANDKLHLVAELTRGNEITTREFNITFVETE
jgi:hypothetical protein